MILRRYLIREVLTPFSGLLGSLVLIFAGYSTVRYLGDAVAGDLPPGLVGQMIGLQTLVTLETLIPLAYYLATVVGLSRLHSDHEMAALQATGLGEGSLIRYLGGLALLLAVVVTVLALQVRPWAYEQKYRIKAEVEEGLDLGDLPPGRFYEHGDSQVVYADQVDRDTATLHNVTVFDRTDRATRVIRAASARMADRDAGTVELRNGIVYELGRGLDHQDRLFRFNDFILHLAALENDPRRYRRKAATSLDLARSDNPDDIAELQWRLTRPLALILLGLMAIPVSRSRPRQGKYARLILAALVAVVYLNVEAVARTGVEKEHLPPWPGLFWSQALLFGVWILAFFRPWRRGP